MSGGTRVGAVYSREALGIRAGLGIGRRAQIPGTIIPRSQIPDHGRLKLLASLLMTLSHGADTTLRARCGRETLEADRMGQGSVAARCERQ